MKDAWKETKRKARMHIDFVATWRKVHVCVPDPALMGMLPGICDWAFAPPTLLLCNAVELITATSLDTRHITRYHYYPFATTTRTVRWPDPAHPYTTGPIPRQAVRWPDTPADCALARHRYHPFHHYTAQTCIFRRRETVTRFIHPNCRCPWRWTHSMRR